MAAPTRQNIFPLAGISDGEGGEEQMATADEHGKWDLASGQLYLASGNNLAHLA